MSESRFNEIRAWVETWYSPTGHVKEGTATVSYVVAMARDLLAALSDVERRAARAEQERDEAIDHAITVEDELSLLKPRAAKTQDTLAACQAAASVIAAGSQDQRARAEVAEARAAKAKDGLEWVASPKHGTPDWRSEYARAVLADLAAEEEKA